MSDATFLLWIFLGLAHLIAGIAGIGLLAEALVARAERSRATEPGRRGVRHHA